jgi:micrococcal nuclease
LERRVTPEAAGDPVAELGYDPSMRPGLVNIRQPTTGDRRSILRRAVPVAVALILLVSSSAAAADTFGDFLDIEVVRVYDGDTFFVDIPDVHPLFGREIGIRVRGIDTPEIRGSCEQERKLAVIARDIAIEALFAADQVDLVDVERGKYFRIVATVLIDGVDLGDILIEAGCAVVYDGDGPSPTWCDDDE